MGKIRQLDEFTANMIAAGEVVERPMGVVKELVENAIDAGSTRIDIVVEEGGLDKITVSDNGVGMDSEDAEKAFLRHATSKIQSSDDLFSIHTMGFRGEALPSIASVSKLTLTTSDGNSSTRIKIEFGKTVSAMQYPFNQGTEVTVEGLFYHTPARLKHLKNGAYENSLIQDIIIKFALSHPEIAFRFISNGREAFATTGQGDLLEVIYLAWGKEVAENAIPVSFEDFDYQVKGYIVKPSITRSTRNFMHIFLNHRMVKTYRLYKAVLDAYEDFIVKQRNPIVVLDIQMDSQLLDVNVHPSKWEVRISKEKQLEYLLKDEIRNVLKNTLLAPKVEPQKTITPIYEELRLDTDEVLTKPYVKEVEKEDFIEEKPVIQYEEKVNKPVVIEHQDKLPEMRVIGQLHRKFILCETEKGLAVLDQHACQERVHYEEILRALNHTQPTTELLVPISLMVGNDVVQRIEELNKEVEELQLSFEPFGSDTIILREVPLWMKEINDVPFLEEVIENFKNERESKYEKIEKKKIATMACHHSIRFNRTLTLEEMKEVVEQLHTCENPYHCPHGRPTFVILDESELTKEFLR